MLFWWIYVACASKTGNRWITFFFIAMWITLFTRFGLSWVMPDKVFDLFGCWWTSGRPSAAIWKMVPTCLLWCVWNERNNRCFEDLERSLEDILASFFHTLYLWTATFVSPPPPLFLSKKCFIKKRKAPLSTEGVYT